MHSYCDTLVQPGPGLHEQSGIPGAVFSLSLTISTSSGLLGGSVVALITGACGSIGVFVPTTVSSQMQFL